MTTNNKKILIVEDDEDFIYILEKKFTMEGFLVVVAKDGQEGVLVAKKEKPSIILSDMLMPKMDGKDMAKKIRESNELVPITFLTNIKDVDLASEIKALQNVDYLIKSDTKIDDIVLHVKAKLEV